MSVRPALGLQLFGFVSTEQWQQWRQQPEALDRLQGVGRRCALFEGILVLEPRQDGERRLQRISADYLLPRPSTLWPRVC